MAECLVSFGKPKVAVGSEVVVELVTFMVVRNCCYYFKVKTKKVKTKK